MGPGLDVDVDVQYALTGSETPKTVMIDSSQVWVHFFSDESNQGSGFSLTYSAVEADLSGESVGSLTIVLISQTFESFNENVKNDFTVTLANQLNVFCKMAQTNCLADSGAEFTSKDIHLTSIQSVAEGLQVTLWVADPNDPAGRQAGLTSGQLQDMLQSYKGDLETDGQFDFVVRNETSPLREPWVIALLCVLGLLVLLLVLVIARDLSRKGKWTRSLASSSDVEMKSREDFASADDVGLVSNSDETAERIRLPSTTNENVYFVNPVSTADEEVAATSSDDPKEEVTDLNANTEVEVEMQPEPLYASTTKQQEKESG